MRKLGMLVFCVMLVACAALRDDMRRAETAFDQARYEDVEIWLSDLERSVPDMARELRARFYYLRGVTAYRLGQAASARHYLALCREEAGEQGIGLRADWRVQLETALSELETPAGARGAGTEAGASDAVQERPPPVNL